MNLQIKASDEVYKDFSIRIRLSDGIVIVHVSSIYCQLLKI